MEMMPIQDITVKNQYLRLDDDIETLMKSIDKIGLIHPLTINENNELLAGGRRYSAAKELGLSEVPIIKVEKSDLEQELISIDENLVRKPLDKLALETCLNRGREIYEELNPTLKKIDLEVKHLSPAEKKIQKQEEEEDTESFAAVTAEKTGLSKGVIKGAIKRDALSSSDVKEARQRGEISSSQTNELIRLDKDQQKAILPYVKSRTVKEVKRIVDTAKRDGVDFAIEETHTMVTPPKEYMAILSTVKKANKVMTQILLEELDFEGKEKDMLLKELKKFKEKTQDYLKYFGDEEDFAETTEITNSFQPYSDEVTEETVVQ